MLTSKIPTLSDIVIFGSPCTVHQDAKNKSLDARGKRGLIIGKSDEIKGFRVYIPGDKVVVVTQHVKNVETLNKEQNEQLRRTHLQDNGEGVREGSAQELTSQATGQVTGRKKCTRKSGWTRDAHVTRSTAKKTRGVNDEQKLEEVTDVANSIRERDPSNYGQAMKSAQKDNWVIAMDEELQALEENNVWELELPPRGSHVLHTKWVFKTKRDSDGEIERYKARLVTCGNEQVFGVDYGLTFAAVMELSTVKIILVLALGWGVPARHGDIPNAYVKADKEEHLEIFIAVPQGMIVPGAMLDQFGVAGSNKLALRLKKSLYELKQYAEGDLIIVSVYVDDLLVTASSQTKVEDFFKAMRVLSIKDLGEVNKFLGMRVTLNNAKTYTIDQTAAIVEMLSQNGLMEANGVKVPIGEESNDNETEPVYLEMKRGQNGEPTFSH
ncbi:unnamed protein product [Peronospora destructor]|uniref:Reverse transcriptase Ty1/copia-type domain-containing protein n=1 Tax=Peronospora destructor TaxID=86335 RepID=A0AAV0T0W3_9STRA|nr:unnamed protein product [Peronospora destructor]